MLHLLFQLFDFLFEFFMKQLVAVKVFGSEIPGKCTHLKLAFFSSDGP
jgi:hypothetical protein